MLNMFRVLIHPKHVWALNKEKIKQVTSSWSLFTQLTSKHFNFPPMGSNHVVAVVKYGSHSWLLHSFEEKIIKRFGNNEVRSCNNCCRGKSNYYYKFWVCVCSLWYPAWNAYAPYCHPWPVRFYYIYFFPPHILINQDFRKIVIEHKMCVLIFSKPLTHFSF